MTSFRSAMVLFVMWSTSVAAVQWIATWVELPSAGDRPGGRFGHTMTVLHDGSAVMFGGTNSWNDVYTLTLNGTIATWVRLLSAGDVPSARRGHTITLLADGNAVMFGGESYFHFNDIYSLTVSDTIATWAQLSSVGDVPSAREGHTITLLADGRAVMFGGEHDAGDFMNDIYTLTVDGTIATWVQLSGVGDVPSGRSGHTMTLLADGSAVMNGGQRNSYIFSDIYSLTVSGTIATWAQLSSVGDVPSSREGHTITLLADGRAVMFSGSWSGSNSQNYIYTLTVDGTIATWVQLSGVGDVPSGRCCPTMTLLADGSAVMFGGGPFLNDIFSLTVPTPLPTPSPTPMQTPLPTPSLTPTIPTIPTLPTAAAVKITLSTTATAAVEEAICETTNIDRGGGTYRSFVDALDAAAVATGGASFSLSCTDRREDGFMLVMSIPFTDGVNATTFSKSVTESSADVASEFESQVATTFGVNITATVSGVVLSVKAIDSTASACHIVLGWTWVAICSQSFFSIRL